MTVSVFEIFKLGIGPSSSHTMGPMVAARRFLEELTDRTPLTEIERLQVRLYGSLALTGRGHATDDAVLLGLTGLKPANLNRTSADLILQRAREQHHLTLLGSHDIYIEESEDIIWYRNVYLPQHTNGIQFIALGADGIELWSRTYFSIGGGFIRDEDEINIDISEENNPALPYPYRNATELMICASDAQITIAELMRANEQILSPQRDIAHDLDTIIKAMHECIDRGLESEGILPGGLLVRRRAPDLFKRLSNPLLQDRDVLAVLDWVNLWALAINEENAAGGCVVTAPTNGAAGVVPAVLRYYEIFCHGTPAGRHIFLLTAAAIGGLFKTNASISGAEVGCQGEVGVACAMAAAGLAAVSGASNAQIENAAEIAMEHNLGLTCDPIGGLVQIPCIERNAVGAVKAIEAAKLALIGNGEHIVSLDKVIATMMHTGKDMNAIYKETSLGGLAVNSVEC